MIKVLKPGSAEKLKKNLELLKMVAADDPSNEPLRALIDDISQLTQRETDLKQERQFMLRMGPILARYGIVHAIDSPTYVCFLS